MDEAHVRKVLEQTTQNMQGRSSVEVISAIAQNSRDLKNVSLEDQYLMGAILGSKLHGAYCEGRRLEQPTETGLANNPRIKELSSTLDSEFVAGVLQGTIPQDSTLYVEDGKVFMDIANRDFANLSPFWQYDNFMAGCCAARSVLTNWEGLTHENETVRDFVTVAVANGIHESWIARGNVGDWNSDLETAYVNLPVEEQDKDLVHYQMATTLVGELKKEIFAVNNQDATTVPDVQETDFAQ